MPTNTRSRRGRGGRPTSSAPATRQAPTSSRTKAASPARTQENPRRRNSRSGSAAVNNLSSLMRDPVPRRGARPGPTGGSVASLDTDILQADDSDEMHDAIEEESDAHESGEPPQEGQEKAVEEEEAGSEENDAEAEQADEEDEGSQGEESVQTQLRIFSLSDLASTAEDLVKRLLNLDEKSRVHQQLLTMKRDAFGKVREIYESADTHNIFLDYEWAEQLPQSSDLDLGASVSIGLANAAVLLDAIHHIKTEDSDLLFFVEQMDDFVPFVFYLNSVGPQDLELSLLLRTHLLIEQLSEKKTKRNMRSLIKEAFCEPDAEGDDATIFANGPFKELAGQSSEQVVELCAERVQSLYELVRNKNKQDAMASLRAQYPVAKLLSSLKTWATDVYHAKSGRVSAAAEAWKALRNEPDEFHDAEEEIIEAGEDEVDSDEELQPVLRFGNGEPSQRSLFRNASSIRALHSKEGQAAVVDYQVRNDELLARRSPSLTAPPSARKRPFSAGNGHGEEEEDDDDEFETDTRQVDSNKRARLSSGLTRVKHRQSNIHHQASLEPSPVRASPSQRHMPLSGYTVVNSPPPSSTADAALIRARKEALMAAHGAASASPGGGSGSAAAAVGMLAKQRFPWTEHDSGVLLEMISDYEAKWSLMERHNHRFNHPRNQQAYRDRARILKVEYLITDCVLPPGFDKVALGKKEIVKIIEAGKNPFRAEYEVGANGRAVNTEYNPNPSTLQ